MIDDMDIFSAKWKYATLAVNNITLMLVHRWREVKTVTNIIKRATPKPEVIGYKITTVIDLFGSINHENIIKVKHGETNDFTITLVPSELFEMTDTKTKTFEGFYLGDCKIDVRDDGTDEMMRFDKVTLVKHSTVILKEPKQDFDAQE